MINIFISYSYDNDDHEKWVNKLADDLEKYKEFHVIYDKYDLTSFNDKNYFMESGIYDSNITLIIATKKYSNKANFREAGVGIETYMAAARHWEDFVKEKKSSTLIIIRDNPEKNVPRYMKGKIYLNFNDDSSYNDKLFELIDSIQNNSRRNRPAKQKSIMDKEKLLNFDKVKEILQINYKKIELISSESDFSSKNKIKYDFWEATTPAKIYFLVLYDNITISQTIDRFVKNVPNIPAELTILRSQSTGYTGKLFHEKNKSVKINEFSFTQFMWDFCIDAGLKNVNKIYQDDYFIDQKVYKYNNSEKEILCTSIKYIEESFINKINSPAILLVLAPGGMGKSTMCDVLANRINVNNNQRAVLIKSEDFKRHENPNFFKSFSVENVYDLYEVYSRIKNNTTNPHFSKDLFNISFLCGNLVIFIDGLDELISIFQENFNTKSFLESLIELNRQLGQAKIIVTSREYYWKENEYIEHIEDEIDEINLLGFDEETWGKYLENRFKSFPDKEKCIKKIKKYINISQLTDDGIVIPFFVDVISEVIYEEISTTSSDLKLNFSNRDYNSNDSLIDYLIYVLLDREIIRQGYNISLKNFMSIFKDISAEFGSINNASFKYDFLSSYFITLYLIDCILANTVNKYSIKHLSNLYSRKNQILKDLASFFSANKKDINAAISNFLATLLNLYKNDQSGPDKSKIEKSISALMYLLQLCNGNSLPKEKRTELIKEVYKNDKIDSIFIWGDFFPIDFSNTEVWNSKFINYSNFCKSKFENSTFYYCLFEGIDTYSGFKDISNITFDSTCDIGELSKIINTNDSRRQKYQLAEDELKKFFRSFYDRGVFTKKLIEQIAFSLKNNKIGKNFLFKLVKDKLIVYDSIGKRYSISTKFQRSVHQLLVNNLINRDIDQLLKEICM